MTPTGKSSIRLFRAGGIQVYLHWSWFMVAAFSVQYRAREYSSMLWNVLEYLSLFLLVLMHEFGHALACRQTGGRADEIVLWPLGGVAYVAPPPRAGALLWSIAAGPLVNVVLLPVLAVILIASNAAGVSAQFPNFHGLCRAVFNINAGLLIFNLLPIYPLDGGQIVRALLWFPFGRARSLKYASIVGFVGVAGVVLLAIMEQSLWMGIIAVFVFMNCRRGLLQAGALAQLEAAPRHAGFRCPSCKAAPRIGNFWRCGQCATEFDTFETGAKCPLCGAGYPITQCLDCGATHSIDQWTAAAGG